MFKEVAGQAVSSATEALNILNASIGSCVIRVKEEVNEEVMEADEAAAAEGDSPLPSAYAPQHGEDAQRHGVGLAHDHSR